MKQVRNLAELLRRDVWAVISVCALAMNVLGAFGPFLALAGLARYLVDHWVDFTSDVWIWLFALLRIDIPPLLGFALSFLVFHIGLVASAPRFGESPADKATPEELAAENRDRLLALILYIPIMGATLLTAFVKLAEASVRGPGPVNSAFVTVALLLVVAAPILAFSLVRPRKLIRRFLWVYAVAGVLLALNFISRILEGVGITKSPV